MNNVRPNQTCAKVQADLCHHCAHAYIGFWYLSNESKLSITVSYGPKLCEVRLRFILGPFNSKSAIKKGQLKMLSA